MCSTKTRAMHAHDTLAARRLSMTRGGDSERAPPSRPSGSLDRHGHRVRWPHYKENDR